MEGVGTGKGVLLGELTGAASERFGELAPVDLLCEVLQLRPRGGMDLPTQAPIARGACESGACLRIEEPGGDAAVRGVPDRLHHVRVGLFDQQLDESGRIEVRDQRRSSITRSLTVPLALMGLGARPLGFFAGVIRPSATRRSNFDRDGSGTILAIGSPRSVTTITSPSFTFSSQRLRFALSSRTPTSTAHLQCSYFSGRDCSYFETGA